MLGSLIDRARQPGTESRYTWGDYISDVGQSFVFGGTPYMTAGGYDSKAANEALPNDFDSYARQCVQGNGVVYACVQTRLLVFSEARFKFRNTDTGRLFGTPALALLERPWVNGSTGELLARMEQDVSIAGNSYWTIREGRLHRMRPSKTTIVLGSREAIADPDEVNDLDLQVVGYQYAIGRHRFEFLLPHEVAHYSPIPDPLASYRGMSWITPILREIEGDSAANVHKSMFFKNAATPNLAIVFDKTVNAEQFRAFKAEMEAGHKGVRNAYKSLYLGGGADVKPVGVDFKQMDFRATTGAGETRIAAAAGVPPVIVGLSEGLQAATYSNYAQARRRFADGTLRPLWRMAAQALETLVPAGAGAELWYDDRNIAFLREDTKDQAEIDGLRARTVRTLVDAGYDPDAAVAYAQTSDPAALVGAHSGLYSVQLQPAGTTNPGRPSTGDDSDE